MLQNSKLLWGNRSLSLRFRCISLNLMHCTPLEVTIPHLYLYSSSSFFYIQPKREESFTIHPPPLFKYENLTLFSSLLSYISSPFFNFCIVSTVCLHSESFIYVNTHSIDIQSFNSNECAYC